MFLSRKRLAGSIVILLLSAAALQSQSAEPPALESIAEKFAGIWRGQGRSPDGEAFTSELTVAWTLDQTFLQVSNRLLMNGESKLFSLTLYGWQPVLKHVVFWSFDSSGSFGEGVARLDSNKLEHEWRAFARHGEIQDFRSTLSRQDEELTFTVQESGQAAPFTLTYKKVRE